ncbi:hypothetical protein ACF1BE_19180 [Streptomyces sp. NPDC014991]|uniref:hypothetical protein n=1 Tax=Streptomyces sp. NPDC014991 TaxID=3364935 RepID=UPI0036FD4876
MTCQLPPRRQARKGEPARQIRKGTPVRPSYGLPDSPRTDAVRRASPARVPVLLYADDGAGRTTVGPPPIAAAPVACRHGIRGRMSRTTLTPTSTGADARPAYRPAPTP